MSSIRLIVEALSERAGISQAEIARSLGVPKKTFNAWLSGRVTCRHAQMLGLALEALSARLSAERKKEKFMVGKIIKDETIVKTHRLTAEIGGGSGGKRVIEIRLDGKYADALSEWYEIWYHGLLHEKPEEGREKIGDTPEAAVDWWVKKRGFSYGRA